MKRHLLATLLVLVCASAVHAQKRPDFSGTWVGISPAENAGNEQVITQTATTITTRHGASGDDHVFTYRLDGSESRNAIGAVVTIAKATWDGDRLVITDTTTYQDGRTVERKQVWSIDQKGQLVVELTRPIPGGTEMRTQTGIYRRK